MITYKQELLQKKQRAEKILADRIERRNWFAERTGKIVFGNFNPYKANKEDEDLIVEALQEFIERIERYFREKSYES